MLLAVDASGEAGTPRRHPSPPPRSRACLGTGVHTRQLAERDNIAAAHGCKARRDLADAPCIRVQRTLRVVRLCR